MIKACLLSLVLCLSAAPAFAQVPPVVNPGGFEFDPSPDHNLVANGGPLLTKYTIDLAAQANPGVVVKTVDLGKPAIGTVTPGKVTVTGLDAAIATLPAGSYVGIVKAEGPGGVTPSVVTDPFTVKPRAPGAPGKALWKQ